MNEPTGYFRLRVGPFLVFAILVAATIPWRSKSYFEGGSDPVVLAKAALSFVALAIAVLISASDHPRPVRAAPMVFLVLYLACTVLGGWSEGDFGPSAVVAVRVLLLAFSVVVLSRRFDGELLVGALIAVLATFAALGSVTGLGDIAEGRLRGTLPPLHPNELASTCALVLLWCVWKMLNGEDRWPHLVGAGIAIILLVATGSRTPIAALGLGSLFLLRYATAVRARTIVILVALVPFVAWVFVGAGLLSELLLRGGSTAGLTTLSNRTIAWQSPLAPKSSPWLEWVGGGLTMKRVEVVGQFWNQQILDSSWVSALVQGGIIGITIAAVWMLYSLLTTLASPPRVRALQLAIIVYLVARGVLESGLFDATTAFLMLFVTLMTTPLRSPPLLDRDLVPANGPLGARGLVTS